ncbi:aminoacyl-tRNA synthetase, partial [Trifolium medium]|nr:aminoacyl-tRNA synthetase [Trifolium medium]
MSHGSSSPVPADRSSPSPEQDSQKEEQQPPAAAPLPPTTRSNRPSRACTIRAASRLYTSQPLPRWNLRSMWELASVLNFLNLFRPLLNISLEFSAEEFETALL